MRWQSEISSWNPPASFVDEQRKGPYRRWVHTHTFDAERGGTRVGDQVEFEVPFEWLVGGFVMRDVQIFAFRQQVLAPSVISGGEQAAVASRLEASMAASGPARAILSHAAPFTDS